MPHLQLQNTKDLDFKKNIIYLYKNIMHDFSKQKVHIRKENFVEIGFSELESDPVNTLRHIYTTLNLGGFEEALPKIDKHLQQKKSYKKNKFSMSESLYNELLEEFKPTFDTYKYGLPRNIEIV
jgi:hypothetical protein